MKKDNITIEILKLLLWIFCGWILWLFVFSVFTPSEEDISDLLSTIAFILGTLTGIIITFILKYNNINNLKQKIKKQYSNINVFDKKSKKLLEKANKVSDKYMKHEKDIQTTIAKGRNITSSSEFQILVENYPDLKSNENVIQLINQIKENEDAVANSKVIYNENVSNYNTLIHSFPISIVRGLFRLEDIDYYEENDEIISDEKLGI